MQNSEIIQFTFSEAEKLKTYEPLNKITINPYQHYEAFMASVADIVKNGEVPERFLVHCENNRKEDEYESPYTVFDNYPIGAELLWLGFVNPVREKRNLKKTFVAEGILRLSAIILNQSPIGYMNVNDGDVFHDVHPKQEL